MTVTDSLYANLIYRINYIQYMDIVLFILTFAIFAMLYTGINKKK